MYIVLCVIIYELLQTDMKLKTWIDMYDQTDQGLL